MAVQVKRIDLANESYETAIIELLDFLALTPEDGSRCRTTCAKRLCRDCASIPARTYFWPSKVRRLSA